MDKQALDLLVTMPDGSVWQVPAHWVADNRAKHYADEDPETTYETEYAYTLRDHYELKDWARNNMNWSDVATKAVQVQPPPAVNFQEGWVNGLMVVTEAE